MSPETTSKKDEIIGTVEAALAAGFADVEVVDVDVKGGRAMTVTVFIDRPGGIDLELCGAVAAALDDLRRQYALEVSSPGLDRPLRTATQFERALGERAYVKTTTPIAGRSVYRGVLVSAGSDGIEMRLDEGDLVALPFATIAKAHLIFDFDRKGGQRE
jgi:ribosome maturation factor RimP